MHLQVKHDLLSLGEARAGGISGVNRYVEEHEVQFKGMKFCCRMDDS